MLMYEQKLLRNGWSNFHAFFFEKLKKLEQWVGTP